MKMNSSGKTISTLCVGILMGTLLTAGGAQAAEEYLKAFPSTHMVYLDGQKIDLGAYVINGSNYVRLRDVGEVMNFNVYWDSGTGTVQIDSGTPYSGLSPAEDTDLDAVRQEIVRMVNEVRRENGVQELEVNDALMAAAQERAETMYTYHRAEEDCAAVRAHGYPHGFGANITAFTGTATADVAQKAVANWVNSPGHFQTMIDPDCDTIGVGIAEDQYKSVCYLFVGNPKSYNLYG